MAARPWLGVSREDEKELLDIAQDHVSGAFE
ncbi:phage virion morphogenesis protein [Stenotrophomonas maltophilia]|nr:phage virion morphogenesis protein [Stenotrophomonas maltophilia]